MHTDQKAAEEIAKQIAALPKEATEQFLKGKRQQRRPTPNPRKAQSQGRNVPKKIHSQDLDPMSAEIEAQFLNDFGRLDKKTRQFRRAYIPGEAHPFVMPEHPRTVVVITAKQREYLVDGKPVLYVDLRHRMTEDEKAAKLETEKENREKKIPGGAKGKRPFQVVREVIMEREI